MTTTVPLVHSLTPWLLMTYVCMCGVCMVWMHVGWTPGPFPAFPMAKRSKCPNGMVCKQDDDTRNCAMWKLTQNVGRDAKPSHLVITSLFQQDGAVNIKVSTYQLHTTNFHEHKWWCHHEINPWSWQSANFQLQYPKPRSQCVEIHGPKDAMTRELANIEKKGSFKRFLTFFSA